MTLFRGTVLDTPDDPFLGAPMRAEADVALLVRAGVIEDRGPWAALRARHPDEEVVDLSDGLVLPGFVDTHVHFPQVRVIGGLGMPLLDWLEQCALPEEARLADPSYAGSVAEDFVGALARAGTTTALVFGAHYAPAVDRLFAAAARVGLRITSGLVVSDRLLRPALLTTPARGHEEGLALAERWHDRGRNRYAVIPRFSLSCSDEMLAACRALLDDVPGAYFTSHLNENLEEILHVERLFDCSYTQSYDRHGLLGPRSVLAHDVHPAEADVKLLAAREASVAHCPTSNAALASGAFPLARHVDAGVRVALGSDVGAGTGFSMLKEGLQAYFTQQQLGAAGYPLTPAHLLHLATSAGAAALGLSSLVGDLSVGKRFDAVWLRPAGGSTLDVALRHASSPEAALARAFALGTDADVAGVWVDGDPLPRVGAR
ncbi:guanine deaminase [Nocardioides panaciterrulae]|uniref:Guanine deaminase n=1 Tax=Nocardioides panaciterrulae TaxID=661492 RepID=A0A7Y9J9T5_9ACTN|nr:guanine deaminase [Nocardioides panaciterrulae]